MTIIFDLEIWFKITSRPLPTRKVLAKESGPHKDFPQSIIWPWPKIYKFTSRSVQKQSLNKTGPLKEKLFGKNKNWISRSALTLNFDLGTCFTAHICICFKQHSMGEVWATFDKGERKYAMDKRSKMYRRMNQTD